MNRPTDQQIIASFSETRSYVGTARELGLNPGTVERRVFKLRANGIELPRALRRFQRDGLALEAVEAKRRKRNGQSQ